MYSGFLNPLNCLKRPRFGQFFGKNYLRGLVFIFKNNGLANSITKLTNHHINK